METLLQFSEYPKIHNVFSVDMNIKKRVWGRLSSPYFDYLKDCDWIGTEKIDGMNIRVMYDGEKVIFGGRTDKAIIPGKLQLRLNELFPLEFFVNSVPMILFGEGYGAGIQAGGCYLPDVQDFILFDIKMINRWMTHDEVVQFAESKGLTMVPEVFNGKLVNAIDLVKEGFLSKIGSKHMAEGMICKPSVPLLDQYGHRIIVKLKTKELRACVIDA